MSKKDNSGKKQSKNKNLLRGNPDWVKGMKSPNPSGRPENRYSLTMAMRKYLEEHPEDLQDIIDRTVLDAKRGKEAARNKIWEYMDGKAPQPLGQPDDDGNLVITIKHL